METVEQRGRREDQPSQKRSAAALVRPGPPSASIQTRATRSAAERLQAPASMEHLLPAPPLTGVKRWLSLLFGDLLMPLRFFWIIARWLWLGAGLLVIAAAAIDYLIKLFTGDLPSLTEAFFSSPVLEIPARHPLWAMVVMGMVLVVTVLAWGAAFERRRRLNEQAERVRQGIRSGIPIARLDQKMRAALVAADSLGTFQLATYFHEKNRPLDALELYRLILEKDPRHFGANYNLGLICAELEQFETAESYCRTAVDLNVDSAEAQGLIAYVLYRLGFIEEAQRSARRAVRLGFSSQMLESLILPGLGVSGSLPAVDSLAKKQ
jgi:tetratricopeptide (TPR) repeat protein